MIHAIITTKYNKYHSTTILKCVDVLDKANKLSYVHLLNMMPYGACIITIPVPTMTMLDICNKQSQILFSNKQDIKANNTTIKVCQTFMCNLSSDVKKYT